MKKLSILLFLCFATILLFAQAGPEEIAKIRQQMAKIRQSTNWNDPAAAKKANAEIQKLAQQLAGGNSFPVQFTDQKNDTNSKPANVNFELKSVVTQANIMAIADRFFKRSYKNLDAVSKNQFDQDYKVASNDKFSLNAVRKLTSIGGVLLTLGDEPDVACVYLTAAVKALPSDTLSINNFGGYLRIIDSVEISIPVFLYANKLFSGSPVILTQLGNSYFELGDFVKAEKFYKEAIKINPDFGQAHSALCDLYIKQNRLQDAILELFAGVKGMGASYSQASNNFSYLQQQSEKTGAKDDFGSKQEFWDETKKQLNPAEVLAPLVPELDLVEMPTFPNCQRVEDWLEGGGWNNAFQSFQSYHAYMMSFSNKFLEVHKQLPDLPPNAVLRDYPNERFALDCITEMFFNYAKEDEKKYSEAVEKITQKVNDAKELYIRNLEKEVKIYTACCNQCGSAGGYCLEECHRKFCAEECPNANKFNEILRNSFNDWSTEFSKLVIRQKKLLDDLYGFSDPWINKIESPYWSRIYAYEIKRVALSIVGNCYADYPQTFQGLSHNDCGTDCSVYANPFVEKPDEVNKNDPNANDCPKDSKKEFSLLVCDVSWDCESYEFGCSAIVAGSVKRNHVRKTTTMFLGVGLEADLGAGKAGGKFGGQLTIGDNGSIDGGLKASASGSAVAPVTKGGVKGGEIEFTVTVMGGVKAEATKILSPFAK